MRILLLSFLFIVANPLMAYNAGQKAQSSFGPAVSEASENDEAAAPRHSSFTASTYSQSYLNTKEKTEEKTEEKEPLPTAPQEKKEAIAQAPVFPVAQAPVSTGNSNWKTKMAAVKDFTVKQTQTESVPQTKNAKKSDDSSQNQQILPAEQPVIPAEATAALEKMGDLQKMMNDLGGSTGGAGTGGFPDLSALMGGGKSSATPAKK